MKNVLLSADGNIKVYSVPDIVADNLNKYCLRFTDWVKKNPEKCLVEKNIVLAFDETDFIEYLNSRFFPQEPSVYVETLKFADISYKEWPKEYKKMPWFNF